MTLSDHVQGDHVHHDSPSLSPTKMSERVPPIGAEDSSCDDKSLAGRSEEVEREESDQNDAKEITITTKIDFMRPVRSLQTAKDKSGWCRKNGKIIFLFGRSLNFGPK